MIGVFMKRGNLDTDTNTEGGWPHKGRCRDWHHTSQAKECAGPQGAGKGKEGFSFEGGWLCQYLDFGLQDTLTEMTTSAVLTTQFVVFLITACQDPNTTCLSSLICNHVLQSTLPSQPQWIICDSPNVPYMPTPLLILVPLRKGGSSLPPHQLFFTPPYPPPPVLLQHPTAIL